MAFRHKHIIWDWNGTLLDDAWLCVEVLNGLLSKRGRAAISESAYRQNFGFPVIDFYEYLGFDTDRDSFDKVSREFIGDYEARWLTECALHSETVTILDQLRGEGFSHSVLSAAKQEALEQGIGHFGIEDHFLDLIGTDNIYATGKVARGRQWIEQLDYLREEVVIVGDTLHDLEVAQNIGTDCILLTHGHHSPERLAATGAPLAHSLSELVEKLETI